MQPLTFWHLSTWLKHVATTWLFNSTPRWALGMELGGTDLVDLHGWLAQACGNHLDSLAAPVSRSPANSFKIAKSAMTATCEKLLNSCSQGKGRTWLADVSIGDDEVIPLVVSLGCPVACDLNDEHTISRRRARRSR